MPLCSKAGEVKYVKVGPAAYSLVPSVTQIRKNASGVLTPSSFTVKAMQGSKELYDKYIQWWGSTDGITWSYMNYKYGSGAVITVKTSYTHYLVRLFNYNPPVTVDDATGWLASINIVVIEDGKNGEDGQKGNRGARIGGPTVWSKNGSYTAGVGTEEYISVVLYRENSDEKYIAYECLITHSNRNVTPKDSVAAGDGYWRVSFYQDFIATSLLLADKIKANMIDATGLYATEVDISGKITATSGTFNNVTINSGKIGGFTLDGGRLWWKQKDYFLNDSRSIKIGVPSSETEGILDVSFNSATTGRFGVKSVGANAGGASIYASIGSLTYPGIGMTFAGFFVGPVDVRDTNYGISSDLCASKEFRYITGRNADGTYTYNKGVNWGGGLSENPDLDHIRLIVRGGIIVGYTGE